MIGEAFQRGVGKFIKILAEYTPLSPLPPRISASWDEISTNGPHMNSSARYVTQFPAAGTQDFLSGFTPLAFPSPKGEPSRQW